MRKKILWILLAVSVGTLALAGCGSGSVSCGDAPVKNENSTDLAQEDISLQSSEELQNIEETQDLEETQNTPAAEGEGPEGLPTPEVSDWGVTLTAKDVTPEGMTIVCTQSGGSPSGELNTGSYYILEQEVQGVWCVVEYAENMRGKEICWDAVAWIIPMNDTVEWEVDWEWLYGSLEPGHYRIGKEVMDFRGTGDYDKEMYYAEFEIVSDIESVNSIELKSGSTGTEIIIEEANTEILMICD